MKLAVAIFFSLMCRVFCLAQSSTEEPTENAINNLVLPKDYQPVALGSGPEFKVSGKGRQTLLIIPGLGFDGSVFDDFVKTNEKRFTMYVVTIPGFGTTRAQPTPVEGTSFGEQSWNKGVLEGLKKLIDNNGLVKPIVVGHFVQGTQLALRLAIDFPDKIDGVIVLGGPAKFLPVQGGKVMEYPLKSSIAYVDNYSAPRFFKTMSQTGFNEGNYLPSVYSLNEKMGRELWNQVASVPLPVMVRYLSEFHASDVTLELDKVKCPVLVLRPGFKPEMLNDTQNPDLNYIKPQFIDSWERDAKANPNFKIQDIQSSGAFVWKDQPEETGKHIMTFVKALKKN
jgi:pimeloyl-ACP methyl ester carboxylesterase